MVPGGGGPYLVKPNLFLSRVAFEEHRDRHGFWINRERSRIEWRQPSGARAELERKGSTEVFRVANGTLTFARGELQETSGSGEVDTSVLETLRIYLDAFSKEERPSWLPPKP